MKNIFILILSMAMVAGAGAQTISPKNAAQKAACIFNKTNRARSLSGESATVEPQLAYVSVLDGDTCFYVFNNPDGGYAIIGGDMIAREVLATVDQGSFDINKMPENMIFILSEYAQQIKDSKGSEPAKAPTWTCGPDITSSLMTTHWTQDPPYNNLCPDYDATNKCATGCVATAAAQAVYKALKGKFTTGKNSKTYNYDVTTSTGKTTVSMTYTATDPIIWDMADTYESDAANDQAVNVAKLMTIMGLISQMEYGNFSGTTSQLLQRGLWNNLNIAAKFLKQEDNGISDQKWEQTIYNELATGRPVIFGADTPDGKSGHEFVLDGYRQSDDNFHVNWGWGAKYDGYFALTATIAKANGVNGENKGDGSWMFPSAQGTGGSGQSSETAANSAYRNGHEIVYNLVMRGANESKDIPEVDADDVDISQQSNQSSARALAENGEDIPTIYVGDGSFEGGETMTIRFGNGIKYNGENTKFIWAVMLEPVFENGEEPDEYDCPILDATNGKDEAVEYKAGDIITGFTIPVGEYAWNETGEAEEGDDDAPYKLGKYSVTPIMYFDADGDSEYIADENIAYIGTPYGWKAPVANFVSGAKPTDINSLEATSQNSALKVVKVLRKHRIVIEKDGKQYNIAGQQM